MGGGVDQSVGLFSPALRVGSVMPSRDLVAGDRRRNAQTPKGSGVLSSPVTPKTPASSRAAEALSTRARDEFRAPLGSLGEDDDVCWAPRATLGTDWMWAFLFGLVCFFVRNKCSNVGKAPGLPLNCQRPPQMMGADGEESWGAGEGKGAKPREVAAARACGCPRWRRFTRPPLPPRPPRWVAWN